MSTGFVASSLSKSSTHSRSDSVNIISNRCPNSTSSAVYEERLCTVCAKVSSTADSSANTRGHDIESSV